MFLLLRGQRLECVWIKDPVREQSFAYPDENYLHAIIGHCTAQWLSRVDVMLHSCSTGVTDHMDSSICRPGCTGAGLQDHASQ